MNNYPPDPYQQTQQAVPPMQPGQLYQQQPGGFSEPLSPAPRKPRRGLWATLIIVVLLLLAGAGAYYYVQSLSSPQKTLQAFCDAVKNNDGLALYNLYSSSQQAKVSEQTVQGELQVINTVIGGIQTCTVDSSSIQQNGSVAIGNVTLVSNRGRTFHDAVDLIDENGQWKIEHSINAPSATSFDAFQFFSAQ